MKTILAVTLAALVSAAPSLAETNTLGSLPDEADLVATCVNRECEKYKTEFLVILAQTELDPLNTIPAGRPDREDWIRKVFFRAKAPDYSTFASFVENNHSPLRLSTNLQFSTRHALLSIDRRKVLGDEPDWKTALSTAYPGAKGVMSVSRPGFNAARTQALICVGHSSTRGRVAETVKVSVGKGEMRMIPAA